MPPRQVFTAMLDHPDVVGAWTYITVPFSVERLFGTRARVAVAVTLNGVHFRGSLLPQSDGTHIVVVNKTVQEAAKAGPGDTVDVALEADTAPRTVSIPYDLAAALAGAEEARGRFETMSYSHKKEYVDWIESAKRVETRAGRIQKALSMISVGQRLKG